MPNLRKMAEHLLYTVLLTTGLCEGLLLHGQGQDKLPQYHTYGRSLVLNGGAAINVSVTREILKLSGGAGLARIGVITASSGTPAESYHYYRDLFLQHGAAKVSWINISESHKELNKDPAMVQLIMNQTGFMFSGGDQARVISSYFLEDRKPSPALLAIRHRFEQGAVVAGTSAGTACQSSRVMVAGGMSWEALRYGAFHIPGHHRDDLVYDPHGGLGFLDGYVLDTHFSERGREGRLLRLLSDTQYEQYGTALGFGVDESTALVITHAGTAAAKAKVLGDRGVVLIDVSRSVVDKTAKYFTIRDVSMSYMTDGDSIKLSDHTLTFSPDKSPLAGQEFYDHALKSTDIFDGNRADRRKKPEFVRVATSVFDAKYDRMSHGTTYEKHPRFLVTVFRSGAGAEAHIRRGHSFQEDVISFKNLMVSIEEN
ncbi:cyanophycinase-like [Liolophura sinensis]|uniref:cyanophycinase-like n=1 Tax=Liolophura sinensis TaxID=3198878 RepID=UPI00315835E3